ncbi:hypothetical protein CIG19_17685 [Enterobacterales bacterium CwR94]|nr:hypothetical protein CIG19_17685 [Enterobacterales bacterium CwR94]
MMFKKLLVLAFAATVSHTAVAQSSDPLMQVDYTKFRYSFNEMYRIANPSLLQHRTFYAAPSTGPDAAWFDAVKQGNLARVKTMVAKGQKLEAKDDASQGQTALGWAAFIGYTDMVHFLVDSGADIRATDRADVYNALKSAVMGGNVEVISYLYEKLKGETDWNKRESDGETLFLVGAVDGRYDFVKWALQFKPDLNVVVKNEQTGNETSSLSVACEKGFYDVAQLLIANGAINNKTGKSSCQ